LIRSFRHKGLERFFLEGSKSGIQAAHASKLRLRLGRLDAAGGPGNWRLVFAFDGEHAVLVDYVDYH